MTPAHSFAKLVAMFTRLLLSFYAACILAALLISTNAWPQSRGDGELDKAPPQGMTVDDVIRRFTAKEKEWKQARESYTYRQSVKVEIFAGNGKNVSGEYRQVGDVSYVGGKRTKVVVLAPQPSFILSPNDVNDIETRATFTISTDELPEYALVYVGQQKVDELHCYVFDIAPKKIVKDKRYFQGRLWVDDQDFQIVKNTGKSVPETRIYKKKKTIEDLFPQFTTWREQIDGKYWFPTFSSCDDVLHFQREDMRIKEVLKFTDYKRAGAVPPSKEKPAK